MNNGVDLEGEITLFDVKDKDGKILAASGANIDAKLAKQIAKQASEIAEIKIKPRLTDKTQYLDAFEEEQMVIGQANIETDGKRILF